ncbi:MAG: CBS domain-containing protein [Labilithrix sp.]
MLCVRDRMTTAVVTVSTGASAEEIMTVLQTAKVTAVPVLDEGGSLVGVVSTTDLVRKVVDATKLTKLFARDLMSAPVVVARPDEPLDDAAWRMVAARAHRLVVVEGERTVGILSVRDVLDGLADRKLAEPIRSIMNTEVITLEIGDPISKAVHGLASAGVHGLVVMDGSRAVGVFTQAEALAARHLPPALLNDPVEEVMSSETICFDVDTPIDQVATAVRNMHVRRILVVHQRQLVGILSDLDLVDVLARAAG